MDVNTAILERARKIANRGKNSSFGIAYKKLRFIPSLHGYICLYNGQETLRIDYTFEQVIDEIYDEIMGENDNETDSGVSI